MAFQGYGDDLSRVSRSVGVYGKTGASGLKLFDAYESNITYQPKLYFYGIGEWSIRKNIYIEMDKAVSRAMKPAKQTV